MNSTIEEYVGFNPYVAGYSEANLFVTAGRGSVSPLPGTVMGIGAFYFPPVSGRFFQLEYKLSVCGGHGGTIADRGRSEHYAPAQVMLQSCRWLPWGYHRKGLFHKTVHGRLVSFQVESELIAPADGDGVLVRLTFHSQTSLDLEISPQLRNDVNAFGVCPPQAWNYEPPSAQALLWSEGPKRWRTDGCTLSMVGSANMSATENGWKVSIKSGEPTTVTVGFSLEGSGLKPFSDQLDAHANSARHYWNDQARKVDLTAIPDRYHALYWRGWVTAMTARWCRETFIAKPYYASEGIDGGAVCSYLWDLSYSSHFLASLEGTSLSTLIESYLNPNSFFRGYSVSPFGGEWLGVFYAFQPYALTKIVEDYVTATRDYQWLNKTIPSGESVIGTLERIVLKFDQKYATSCGLLDFGHNRHLIELQVADYEGIVPNPNFEHAWTLAALERLRGKAGLAPNPALSARAQSLLSLCQAQFWNGEQGWYFPDNAKQTIWSIQILSALRLGVFPKECVAIMAKHLLSPRFLGTHGLYSIAKDDRWHFTLFDADWGGGGCFTGHTAIILEGLAHYGLRAEAESILERLQWWVTELPYIPQSTLADAPRLHGRVNAVAGAGICQALRTLYPLKPEG